MRRRSGGHALRVLVLLLGTAPCCLADETGFGPAPVFSTRIHGDYVVAELGGGTVHLVWIKSDAVTLLRRLTARGLGRDAAKLAEFERFCASMRVGAEPDAPHLTVDNRLTAAIPLAEQVAFLVKNPGGAP